MAKVSEVITDALEDLVVQAEEAPVEQDEAGAVIRTLNDMMFAYAADGIDIGYTQVSSTADVLTVPDGAIFGIKKNLAIALASKYEVPVTPDLAAMAKRGFKTLVNLAVEMSQTEYPSTLPQGSGNDYPSYSTTTFYPEQENTILTESGGSVALEEDTEEAS